MLQVAEVPCGEVEVADPQEHPVGLEVEVREGLVGRQATQELVLEEVCGREVQVGE